MSKGLIVPESSFNVIDISYMSDYEKKDFRLSMKKFWKIYNKYPEIIKNIFKE